MDEDALNTHTHTYTNSYPCYTGEHSYRGVHNGLRTPTLGTDVTSH